MAKGYYKEKPSDIHAHNIAKLKTLIKSGSFSGCYVFYGDEEYTKNHYYGELCKSCPDTSLNVKSLYGREFNLKDFINACDTYAIETLDMFAEDSEETSTTEKLRVVRLVEPDLSVLSGKDADYFTEFIEDLPEGSAVIFWFYAGNTPDFSKGVLKKLPENVLIVNFKKEPVGSAVLITWILRHFAKAKLNVERNVAVYLCSSVGNDMTNLKNEIDKCIDYLKFENRDTLTIADVDFLCTKSFESQTFDITKYAFNGNFASAAKALKTLMSQSRSSDETAAQIFGAIYSSVNSLCTVERGMKKGLSAQAIAKTYGMPDFVVSRNIAIINDRNSDFKSEKSYAKTLSLICFEYDGRFKGSKTKKYDLLLELIFKISTAGRI